MAAIQNGKRVRISLQVHRVEYNKIGWFEYQLIDSVTGQLYRHGALVREKDLKAGGGPIGNIEFDAGIDLFQAERDFESRHEHDKKTSTKSSGTGADISSLKLQSELHAIESYDRKPQVAQEPAETVAESRSFVDSGYASEEKKTSKSDDPTRPTQAYRPTEDDTGSIYSDRSSVASGFRDMYIAEIAADILEHIPAEVISSEDDSIEKLYGQLPRLLKGFAIELASMSKTQESRDAMVFISKYRQ